jgi:hypothetical protein
MKEFEGLGAPGAPKGGGNLIVPNFFSFEV